MKKALPILFVASTALITAASLTFATNGSYTQLRAADSSVSHTITFTKDDVVSTESTGFEEHISLNKKTQSEFDFGCVLSVELGSGEASYGSYIVNVDNENDDASISLTFNFKNVLSADSVSLNGYFEEEGKNVYTVTKSTQTSDGYKISVNLYDQSNFYINSIVVKYTCGY